MKLVVDPEVCVGHGRCYSLHPTLFRSDDDGYASAAVEHVEESSIDAARAAVAECPESAIELSD